MQTKALKVRLKRVRQRKKARKGFSCRTMDVKMKLVRRRRRGK